MLLMQATTVASVTEKSIVNSLLVEISCYEVYSIATASFTPPHALTIPVLRSISNKNFRRVGEVCQIRRSDSQNYTRGPADKDHTETHPLNNVGIVLMTHTPFKETSSDITDKACEPL